MLSLVTASLGVGEVLFLLILIGVVVGLIVLLLRVLSGASKSQRSRECPKCGKLVKRGLTTCPSCSHEFGGSAAT